LLEVSFKRHPGRSRFCQQTGFDFGLEVQGYTSAAEAKNAETVLVLHDPPVAQRYGQEWERLWGESQEMKEIS